MAMDGIRPRLSLLILAVLLTSGAPARAEIEHVFIIVIDGIRASEGIGDPSYELVGEMMEQLAPQGSLLTYMEVRGQTVTLPAHQVAVTGTYADYANFGPYEGRENFLPRTPTLFDVYRHETGAPIESCWIVSNTYLVGPDASHCLMPGCQPDGGATTVVDWSYTLEDSWVWSEIDSALDEHEVALMLVNLHEVDRIGHMADWDGYTGKIQEASEAVTAFWERLQADPVYAGNTALFITTDHGRHLPGTSTGWQSHGCSCKGCRQVFLLALGPGIREGFVGDQPCSFLDIAPTVAHLMDLPLPYHRGRVLTEILEDGDQVSRGPGGAFAPDLVRVGERVVRTYEWQDPSLDDEGAHRVVVDVSDDGGETWDTTLLEGGAAIQHSPIAWTDGASGRMVSATRAMEAWASRTTSQRAISSRRVSPKIRSCSSGSPLLKSASYAPLLSTESTCTSLPATWARARTKSARGLSAVGAVAANPMRVPIESARSTIGSSILSTGISTIMPAASAQGETEEHVSCTTLAPASCAATACSVTRR